ncbi:PspC domain-containing protein [Echinimonas agarilytica]|uniref:PspC domain-containing protein n=1 Tax=Echinimonas agarilytica TaxID=1215918 RepID=A0AA41W563_9GAMM|nr:PspC domain-containing protein [Echinimonas agarilytica]MCM2678722.1 PspC domain-containing protein [Echinimonas agarilytica]
MRHRHYENTLSRRPVEGKIAGVIAGFAENWGLSRFWLRIVALVLLFSMPLITLPCYILAALLMPVAKERYHVGG